MSPHSISRRTLLAGVASVSLCRHAVAAATLQKSGFPLLVDLDWLAKAATEPNLRLFDVSPLHVWRSSHIDSAQHAWWRDTVDPNYPVFGAVLTQGDEQSHRQRVLDSLKLSREDHVVVYDSVSGFRAARLVWFLRFLGFSQAALLNASVADWRQEPFAIESTPASIGNLTVDPQPGYYLVTQQLLDRLDTPGFQLIDIRTDDERADDLGGAMPTGQIPGSIRFPWPAMLDDDSHLESAGRIASLAIKAGLNLAHPTVLYGRFGVDTAFSWLALANAGFTNLQIYDRGWAEWSTGADLPREPLS